MEGEQPTDRPCVSAVLDLARGRSRECAVTQRDSARSLSARVADHRGAAQEEGRVMPQHLTIPRAQLLPPPEPMRVTISDDHIEELVESLRTMGQLVPLIVTPAESEWRPDRVADKQIWIGAY